MVILRRISAGCSALPFPRCRSHRRRRQNPRFHRSARTATRPSPTRCRASQNVAVQEPGDSAQDRRNTEIVKFDPEDAESPVPKATKDAEAIRDIRNREARIDYVEKDGRARHGDLVQGTASTPRKSSRTTRGQRLVAQGPKGITPLIDSRPLPRCAGRHDPRRDHLPVSRLDSSSAGCPPTRTSSSSFFCQGVTCMMSPNSLVKAEALGYKNVKVYGEATRSGSERTSAVSGHPISGSWIDKGHSARAGGRAAIATAAEGAIPGAVSVPPSRVRAAVADSPTRSSRRDHGL